MRGTMVYSIILLRDEFIIYRRLVRLNGKWGIDGTAVS